MQHHLSPLVSIFTTSARLCKSIRRQLSFVNDRSPVCEAIYPPLANIRKPYAHIVANVAAKVRKEEIQSRKQCQNSYGGLKRVEVKLEVPRSHVETHFPATIITIILSSLAFCSSSLPLLLVTLFYLLSFSFLLLAYRFLLVDSCLSTLACRLLLADSCLPTLACRLLLADSCLSTLACRLLLVDSCFLTIISCLLLATNTKLSTCYGFVLPVPLSASFFSFLLAQGTGKLFLHNNRFPLVRLTCLRRATPLS
ncbi:hypothetical protein Tco_0210910 [Tanacetum coccineum]